MTKDARIRSVVKAFSWRIIATIIIALFVGIFTHNWDIAATVGGWTFLVNLVLYYFHERIWEHISWGRVAGKKKKR